MQVRASFKVIESVSESWEMMASRVAQVLTMLGPERVIGVSQSQEGMRGTMVVWYWESEDDKRQLPEKAAIGGFPYFPVT
jgi:hypothetical protein